MIEMMMSMLNPEAMKSMLGMMLGFCNPETLGGMISWLTEPGVLAALLDMMMQMVRDMLGAML
jgi:hypothetical protein